MKKGCAQSLHFEPRQTLPASATLAALDTRFRTHFYLSSRRGRGTGTPSRCSALPRSLKLTLCECHLHWTRLNVHTLQIFGFQGQTCQLNSATSPMPVGLGHMGFVFPPGAAVAARKGHSRLTPFNGVINFLVPRCLQRIFTGCVQYQTSILRGSQEGKMHAAQAKVVDTC